MSRILPNPGTYNARRNGPVVVREEESGSLMVYIPYVLLGCAVAFSGMYSHCIGTKDGTPMKKNIDTLKKIFPDWEGENPFELEDIAIPEGDAAEFELADCYHDDTYTPPGAEAPVVQFKAQWLNPLGGGLPSKEPMADADRKKVLTRWQSKFKALKSTSGASAAAKPAAAKPAASAAAPARPAPSAPPARKTVGGQERTASQQEVWDALTKANPDETPDDLTAKYWAAQDEVAPGSNGELTLVQWGEVAEKLGV